MRPRLKPVLRRVERDGRTLQFGVHPSRAIVLTDLEPAVRRLVESLDGTRTLEQVVSASGLRADAAHEVVALLVRHGLVEDASAPPGELAALSREERELLRPELERLSLTAADGGLAALRRRRAAQIRVYGAGRVGAGIVALLAASGVGHICVVDPGTARPRDTAPGGLGAADVGASREEGAVAVARRLAPGVNAWTGRTASRPADGAHRPDLAILAPVEPLDALLVRELHDAGVPHLLVAAFEGWGCVGPLVRPGDSPCLDCLDLFHRDRDPAWPSVRARLGGFPAGEIACDAALSALVAAQAAGQALAVLEGAAVSNGTLEITPDWRWNRRAFRPHPRCRCGRNHRHSLTMVA
ncbi:ThiF family adenylyltransferase [Microtetraspora niveoalba]|uniref:ThiF family adenylyltransferase n=1 Tax=Microtetraspora niveoalba TaxID=46175 RepID=UPI00082EFB35|nr:ThiF family adenylyltransferase [Microtetraspora niveoalba]